MLNNATNKTLIPASYAMLIIELCQRWHLGRDELLAGSALATLNMDEPEARISMGELRWLLERALRLTGEPALAYHVASVLKLSVHGFLGFAVMTSATLGDAIALVEKFSPTRTTAFQFQLLQEKTTAVLQLSGQPMDAMHGLDERVFYEAILLTIAHVGIFLLGNIPEGAEIRLTAAKPDYYAAHAASLPLPLHYGSAANQMRFPAALLQQRLDMADAVSSQLARAQCERELAALSVQPLLSRVQALLRADPANPPDLDQVARCCNLSTRSLKRKLAEQGSGFSQLLAAARCEAAIRLLCDKQLGIAVVADRMGFGSATNFSRAFKAWTGMTPREFLNKNN